MSAIEQKYSSSAKVLTIYVKEAHPVDKWPLFKEVCFKEPKTIQERCEIAMKYKEVSGASGTILVDNMDNQCNTLYSTWPERLYIIQAGKIVYKSATGPEGYHPEVIEEWIRLYNARNN